jgi:citrate lyase subunit beta/citryl-CoA lyase
MTTSRSYLFVPGNRPERFAKALASGADSVIIDLEDAVPPGERNAARATVAGWLSPERPVLVRVNGPTTEWFQDDIGLATNPGVAGIVLPKAESTDDIRVIPCPVLPIIETAHGFWNAHALSLTPNARRLLFGSIDFQVDLGISGEDDELLYFRSQLVLISRLGSLPPPVDGITRTFDTPDAVRADTLRAQRLGFGGKLCIHPKQIATVNECFGPTPEEVAWANRVIEASASVGGAALSIAGEMIDRPVVAQAEAILRRLDSRSKV